jgi:hypothetical protein
MPRLLEKLMVKRLWAVPGIARVQLADLRSACRMTRPFQLVYFGRRLRTTTVQREMVATVVNGLIGGALTRACIRLPWPALRLSSAKLA